MRVKNPSKKRTFSRWLIGLFLVFTNYFHPLNAELWEELTEEQFHAIREEVQEAIREAEKFSRERKYAEALRLLFDAMYKEERTWFSPPYSPDASDAKIKLEKTLIHKDQSPLMQVFRDPDLPLQEKRRYISELRELADKASRENLDSDQVLFRGKYRGTLVQLMLSPKLSRGEKFDVLFWIESMIRKEYTSEAQQIHIRNEINRLRREADQKFREQRYVDAFALLTDAIQKAYDIELSGNDQISLSQQKIDMVKSFVQLDESPLMQFFKSWWDWGKDKEGVWDELKIFAKQSRTLTDTVMLQGKVYQGTLVQIMSHPQVSWPTKLLILDHLEDMIK